MRKIHVHVGLRTIKTVAAVLIAMLLVDYLGTSSSKLIFAMLGAMAAVQPTFKASLESCLTQIVGVFFGAVVGVLLQWLPLPGLVCVGIGILLVIVAYNLLHIRYSPSLPCFIVVLLCTSRDVHPMIYALERIWDTAIGLGVGLAINMLIMPYDNSRRLRALAKSLEREVITFLEEMFDGDDILPDAQKMTRLIDDMDAQLMIFSNQRLWMRIRKQKSQIEMFRSCERRGKELIARMEVLHAVGFPGALTPENRQQLIACGAVIRDERLAQNGNELDIVTNYHVRQMLKIREELLAVMQENGLDEDQ